tara:strand:+ start:274 stop:588 length:315 start_codon:yes stop_codon:yes gene_type:complete
MKNNKLIAEFMGLVVSDSDNYTSELHTNVDVDLKYHTSWDWLMPVVDKIEIEGFDPHGLIDNALGSREIEDVHDACVTLIKAHNSERNRWKEQTRIEEGLDHKG